VRRIVVTFATILAVAAAVPARAQTAGSGGEAAQAQAPPAPAQEDDDPDRDINRAQPDFTLVALPTTLRVPRHRSSFRITHRFGRPLGQGDFGDLLANLFGLDSGAIIGLEYRVGLFRGTQIGIHRTSDRTIQFMAQQDLKRQSEAFPFGINLLGAIEGLDNFQESYSPSLGVILSREVADWAALYVEPIWVNNSNPLPEELADDNNTVLVGLGARIRVRPTVYLVFEGSPRVSGHDPGHTQASFGIEKRSGGHLFQLNFSNGFGTTFGQLARGGVGDNDWYLGFNISRKFF
jgi:hypothetical protein